MQLNQEPYPFERISSIDPAHPYSETGTPSKTPLKKLRQLRLPSLHGRKKNFKIKSQLSAILKKSSRMLTERHTLVLFPAVLISARAGILGELYPFGFAVFTAFSCGKKERIIPFMLLNLLGTSLSAPGIQFQSLSCLCALGLLLWKLPKNSQRSRILPAALAGLTLFFVKTLFSLSHGILYYEEMLIVIEALFVFFLSYVFSFYAEALQTSRPLSRFNFEEISSAVLLGGVLLLGISDWQIWDMNLCSILCRSAVLYSAYFWGSGGGTMMGVTAGIIPSLSTGLFAQSLSMYAAAGLLAGWFRKLGRLPIIMAFFSGVLGISFYAIPAGLTIQNLEESLLAALLFYFTAETVKNNLPLHTFQPGPDSSSPQPSRIPSLSGCARQRIDALAQVFDEISASLNPQEETIPPSPENGCLNYLYENIQQKLCSRCMLEPTCWEQYKQSTSEDMLSFFKQADKEHPLSPDTLPPRLKHRCIHRQELTVLVNRLHETLKIHQYFTEKISESKKLIAGQMQNAGELIRGMEKSLDPMFLDTGAPASKKPIFRIETGSAQQSRESLCGDSFSLVQLPGQTFAVLLSDGMGVGESAHQQSQTVIRLLQTMLQSHFDLEVILKTINSVLLLRTADETFATLDLLFIDLFSGEASLIKTAAAPSFLYRRSRLRVIRSSSLPIGILQEFDVCRQTLRLEDNDLLILTSDGMSDAFAPLPEEQWMKELLQEQPNCNCQYLADTLMAQTLARHSGIPEDDITILCLRLIHL